MQLVFGAGLLAGANPGVLAQPAAKPATAAVHGEEIGTPVATAAAPKISTVPTAAAAKTDQKKGPLPAGFDKLSAFKFVVSDEMQLGIEDAMASAIRIRQQIPDSIKALNEKEVSVTGFMLPVNLQDGKAVQFMLLKTQSLCCFGAMPAMNEYVMVRLAGGGVKPVMDQLVTVTGTLHVGEFRDNRFLTGIYRLDGDKVDLPVTP